MQKLIESGVYGKGLILISSPKMVERYNQCLESIGIEPTELTEFTIDGIGWSPQIAIEKENNFYLSHGGANQYAVIVSPKQYKKPVYLPYYSFFRMLMKEVFDRYKDEIADITKDSAIWLEIDQEISHYSNPMDLLSFEEITVQIHTSNGLMTAGQKQKELINQLSINDGWFNPELRQKLVDSSEKYGDFRKRKTRMNSFEYDEWNTFYTHAFNGMYIIRQPLPFNEQIVILEDKNLAKELGKPIENLFCVTDIPLLVSLARKGIVELDWNYYRENSKSIHFKKEQILVNVIAEHCPDVDIVALNDAQKKRYIVQLSSSLPQEFFDLERLEREIDNGKTPDINSYSDNIYKMLMHPATDIPQSIREVLWRLITEIKTFDVFTLYIYNKNKFFKLYQQWPTSKQKWVVEMIENHYKPKMDSDYNISHNR